MGKKNLQAYARLDLRKFADQYVVFVEGKLIGAGHDLDSLLRKAKKKYPSKIPAVAKVAGPQTLVLRVHF